ncbi:hypothetical protein F2P81_021561 [Scophthalmus maximus]|uniref:Uncharacterized protein n=1 Tax=Scophthalmus maximus TaxID=52904 RepID=A0A6A4S879_SCOMX|nr:hypothetical protein F2P81_021561 [Scophthalmus maximus]
MSTGLRHNPDTRSARTRDTRSELAVGLWRAGNLTSSWQVKAPGEAPRADTHSRHFHTTSTLSRMPGTSDCDAPPPEAGQSASTERTNPSDLDQIPRSPSGRRRPRRGRSTEVMEILTELRNELVNLSSEELGPQFPGSSFPLQCTATLVSVPFSPWALEQTLILQRQVYWSR